ncbi:glycosyltransferase [Aquihabitans sp. McL0605]|uniref:glycosyltransferase n=1 Tax=Aquihabitans sp. McL0605 TaxID=3415671 RepID=UPI003CF0365B
MASEYRRRTAAVEIVVPVHNEAAGVERSVRALHDYLADRFPLPWLITIVDNASTDDTWERAAALHADLADVQAMRLAQKGRGRALRAAWRESPAPVVAYMDVDLSTDLDALLPLVAPLLSGHSDVAIGTRLAAGSRVTRGPKREAISRTYNLILRTTLHSGFSDAQCGFKAVRRDVAQALLPLIEDEGWFFDTELLVLAEHNGLRIHEVPVDWVDDPDSRVDILRTATDDLRGVGRMLRRFGRDQGWIEPAALADDRIVPTELGSQLVRFASVGVVSTLLFAVLFAAFYGPLGAVAAAIAALAISSVANTAANRRLTFSQRGRRGRRRHWTGAMAVSALPLALDLVALAAAAAAGVTSTLGLLVALTVANGLATAVRFVGLRRSMGR